MEKITRRSFLTITTLGSVGLVAEAQAETRRKLPIVVFFQGGAQSPYEFVSPLHDSVAEFRGDVSTILASNGERIDSRWTNFARVANQTAVIRSLDSGNVSHNAKFVVGEPHKDADKFANGGIPHPFIELPSTFSDKAQLKADKGFHIRWNAEQRRFAPPEIRPDPALAERYRLLQSIERPVEGRQVELMHRNRELAVSLLLGGDRLEAPFRRAEAKVQRYGDNEIGRAAALASEFARSGAGISFVYNEFGLGWDAHSDLKNRYDTLIPPTDRALAALVEDSRREGFLLLMSTEHGRTTRVNASAGRDHHTVGYAVLAGEGIRPTVYGSVDRRGEIRENPVRGDKIMKTLFHAAGHTGERFETLNEIL